MYPLFLLALFVAGGGITVLQVAANPYISVLGPEESASAHQLVPSIQFVWNDNHTGGSSECSPRRQILSSDDIQALSETKRLAYYAQEASAVQVPFVLISLAFFALAGVVAVISLPKILGEGQASIEASYGGVLRNKKLLFGALGIFVYVGAEVALGSYMVDYGLSLDIVEEIKTSHLLGGMAGVAAFIKGVDVSGLDAKGVLGALLTFYWGGAMVGRFAGSVLMQRMAPSTLLAGAATLAFTFIGLSIASMGVPSLLLLLAVGFCNSIIHLHVGH